MIALLRLRDKGLLSGAEYARLAAAYQFLRNLEHRLQMEEDRQTHTLPSGRRASRICWRARCRPIPPASASPRKPCATRLNEHLARCAKSTSASSTRTSPSTTRGFADGAPAPAELDEDAGCARAAEQPHALSGPARAAAGADGGRLRRCYRGRERFEHFLEKAFANPDLLDTAECRPDLAPQGDRHFRAQSLLRRRSAALSRSCSTKSASHSNWKAARSAIDRPLRRFYRRQMLRIQSGSILRSGAHLRDAQARLRCWPIA